MNPIQRAWAYVSKKTTVVSFILFLTFIDPIGWNFSCLTLMKSNKTVETNLYKSLNTSFSIKKIENGQTFKLSDLASVSKIKGLEKVTSLDESSSAVKLTKFLSAADKSSRSTLCSPLTASFVFLVLQPSRVQEKHFPVPLSCLQMLDLTT